MRINMNMRKIIREFDLYSRRLKNKAGLTAPQLVCLKYIMNNEPATITEIAKSIHLSNSTVLGIIDRLEAKNYIRRERSTEDRRLVNLILLEKGKTLLSGLSDELRNPLTLSLVRMSQPEREEVDRALRTITDNIKLT